MMTKLSDIRCETCPHYEEPEFEYSSYGRCKAEDDGWQQICSASLDRLKGGLLFVYSTHACNIHPLWQQMLKEEETAKGVEKQD